MIMIYIPLLCFSFCFSKNTYILWSVKLKLFFISDYKIKHIIPLPTLPPYLLFSFSIYYNIIYTIIYDTNRVYSNMFFLFFVFEKTYTHIFALLNQCIYRSSTTRCVFCGGNYISEFNFAKLFYLCGSLIQQMYGCLPKLLAIVFHLFSLFRFVGYIVG